MNTKNLILSRLENYLAEYSSENGFVEEDTNAFVPTTDEAGEAIEAINKCIEIVRSTEVSP